MIIKDKETYIYNAISENDFLLVAAANAAAGTVGFGLPGFLSGIAIGIIDETLVNLGYTNSRYLSSIIQGVSSFATLTTSWVIRGAGGLLSFTFYQLTISENNEHIDKIPYITQTALQTGYAFGWKGAVGGVVLGGIEEVFIYYNFYNKHYISIAISFISITHLLKEKGGSFIGYLISEESKLNIILTQLKKMEQAIPYFLESLVVVASSIKVVCEENEEPGIAVLDIQKEIKGIYKKLGQEVEYFNMLEKQVLAASGFAIVEQFLQFKLIGCLQKPYGAFYGDLTKFQIWDTFKVSLKEILKMIPGLVAIKQICINPVEAYFSFQFQNQLYDAVSNKWIVDEIPLKILQKENTETLIDNLNKDITVIANKGEGLRKSFFNEIIKSSYSQYLMYQYNAQDLIIIYQIYYSCTQYISEKLAKWELVYNNAMRDLEGKKNSMIKHDARNVETIVERNGFTYSKMVLKSLNNEMKLITTKQQIISNLHDTWKEIEIYMNSISIFFLIGYKTYIGELHPDIRLKALIATESISSLMSWRGKNAGTVEEVKNSLKKLNTFIDKIEDVEDTNLQSFKLVQHINKELVLKDLYLTVENQELLYAKEIILNSGMYYALTGDSGSGKSSLLSKIKGIMYNGIKANGIIKYPNTLDQVSEIVLMSQKDFFPIDVTLLEAIYYPQLIYKDQKEKIYSKMFKMLEKIDLCNGNSVGEERCDIEKFMNTKKDWSSVLSGGQKKKVLLISALVQDPKVLLLDEPFTGLHQKAIPEIQSFIKETLKSLNTLVICIDHHVSDSKNFYDFELYIENRTLNFRKFLNEAHIQQEYIRDYMDDVFFNKVCPIEENL